MTMDWVKYRLDTAEETLARCERQLKGRRADVRDMVAQIRKLREEVAELKAQIAERDR